MCRSEEHTSELQSHLNLVCRLLLEKTNALTPASSCSCIRRVTRCTRRDTSTDTTQCASPTPGRHALLHPEGHELELLFFTDLGTPRNLPPFPAAALCG